MLSRLAFVNVPYGALLEQFMVVLMENSQEITLPTKFFSISQNYFLVSRGKLSAYDLPISMVTDVPVYIAFYLLVKILDVFFKFFKNYSIKNGEKVKRRCLVKCKELVKQLWSFFFGVLVLDVMFGGLHEIFHTSFYGIPFTAQNFISYSVIIIVTLLMQWDC